MKDSLLHYWKRFSRREKFLCAAAAGVLLLYASYALVLENSVRDALNKDARLARLNAEYQSIRAGSRRLEELKGSLAGLGLELEKKREEGRLLAEGLQSRRPAETLLHELRQAAGAIPLQLVGMDIKTGVISKSREFAVERATGAAPGEPLHVGAMRTVKVDYTVSKIVLSYRSTYHGAVNYFLKVMDLPYAISVNTVEMERSNMAGIAVGGPKRHIAGGGVSEGELPLNTKLGIEIFYR
ncbi:MAG: type II secretion system protein M [Nitrospinae bacterium]|nr:type II secretion system protein M [Nitrospinota bacterium]